MANFKYRVMNNSGEKIEGNLEANSKDEVIIKLSENGYYPLVVEEIVESANITINFNNKVKIKDIGIFCRQFYTMLNAGVPIITCLEILCEQAQNKKLKNATRCVKEEVEKGEVLSVAMKQYGDVFPELLISLIASGEASGKLENIMLRMAANYEKENKINNKVQSAMIYPCVLGAVSIGAVVFILTYVMPTFMDIFKDTGTSLPWTTRLLIFLSEGIKNNWLMIILILTCAVIGIKTFLKTDVGKIYLGNLKLKLPIIKKLNQMIIVSRFTRTLSVLLSSGLQLTKSLEIVSGVCGNKIAEKDLLEITEKVTNGESLYTSMKEYTIFPPMLYSMIKIGENTGSLDDILNKTADFYDEEVESMIQTTVALIEPILIVVMGLTVGFIVAAIMLPMFDMYGQI